MKKSFVLFFAFAIIGGLAWVLYTGYAAEPEGLLAVKEERVAPVEVAPIERGSLTFRRTFSGTVEASAEFIVAPKISGRIVSMRVDLADRVERGQTVVTLDDSEYVQAVSQAQADMAVARATLAEAESTLEISERELGRLEKLRAQGVASESQFDEVKMAQLAAQARLEVARAHLQRATASLESARIRLAYTSVNAEWTGGSDRRVVAERFVDVGDTVSANTPLLSIVELAPITGTIFVTERDYANISLGQTGTLTTDAFPGEEFTGSIVRISPVFRQASRQARVEIKVDNPEERLKPGMFINVTIALAQTDDAIIVPDAALTAREGKDGVFVVNEAGTHVKWVPVEVGLREAGRVGVSGEGLTGRVVTLGQQLLDDGSAITIPDHETTEAA